MTAWTIRSIRAETLGLLLAFSSNIALAGATIRTTCQKNMADGRILITDEKVLPAEDSTFKVLTFKGVTEDSGWLDGPCTIKVTGHAR